MPAANPPAPQPLPASLTLPRAHFAKLAPSSFLSAHLCQKPGTRPNGRLPAEFRRLACTTSSLAHASGSAVVRQGGTAVVVGISAETLAARDAAKASGGTTESEAQQLERLALLVPVVELSTGCSPAHAPAGGSAPGAQAQTLGVQVLRLLLTSGVVALEDLLVRRGGQRKADDDTMDEDADDAAAAGDDAGTSPDDVVAYWTLYINVVVLSLDGSTALLDVVWAAVYAALSDVRLPRAWLDEDRGVVLCSDSVDEARRLRLRARPAVCTWAVFVVPKSVLGAAVHGKNASAQSGDSQVGRRFVLADPDALEDEVCKESARVVIDCSKGRGAAASILAMSKSGGLVLGPDDMMELVKEAERRWIDWNKALP